MRLLRFLFSLLVTVWLVLLIGCDWPFGAVPPEGEAGAAGAPATTGEGGELFTTTTGSEASDAPCDGECHLWKTALFEDLSLFWIGPPGEAPPCPAVAPAEGAVLHADLQAAPLTCPTCTCVPGGCTLPDTMHASAAKCPANGAPSLSWDTPAWEGACTAQGAIAPGLLCAGVPCVQSFSVAAPQSEPCAAVSEGAEIKADPVWGLTARECIAGPFGGEGCGGSEACTPAVPQGFALCLYRWGDDLTEEDCPAEYPRYLQMHAGQDDTRACEPCMCEGPQGGDCSALVSVFTDGACGAAVGSVTVSTGEPGCVDVPAGAGLGSKQASWVVQTPGSCTAHGGAAGDVAPALPVTLCCQPEAPSAE